MTPSHPETDLREAVAPIPRDYSWNRAKNHFYNHNTDYCVGTPSAFHKRWFERRFEFPDWTPLGPVEDARRAELATLRTENTRLTAQLAGAVEALTDLIAGWRYIQEHHGDLYGVGWDRAERKAAAVLAALSPNPKDPA